MKRIVDNAASQIVSAKTALLHNFEHIILTPSLRCIEIRHYRTNLLNIILWHLFLRAVGPCSSKPYIVLAIIIVYFEYVIFPLLTELMNRGLL